MDNPLSPTALTQVECDKLRTACEEAVSNLTDGLADSLTNKFKNAVKDLSEFASELGAEVLNRTLEATTEYVLDKNAQLMSTIAGVFALTSEIEVAIQAFTCFQLRSILTERLTIAIEMQAHIDAIFGLIKQLILLSEKANVEDPIIKKVERAKKHLDKAVFYISRSKNNLVEEASAADIRRANSFWKLALYEVDRAQDSLGVTSALVKDISDIIFEHFGKDTKGLDDDDFVKVLENIYSSNNANLLDKIYKKSLEYGLKDKKIIIGTAIIAHTRALVDLYPMSTLSYLFNIQPSKFAINNPTKEFGRLKELGNIKTYATKKGLNTLQIQPVLLIELLRNFPETWSLVKFYSDKLTGELFTDIEARLHAVDSDMKTELEAGTADKLYHKRVLWDSELSLIHKILTTGGIADIIATSMEALARKNAVEAAINYTKNVEKYAVNGTIPNINFVDKPYDRVGINLVNSIPLLLSGIVSKTSAAAVLKANGSLGNAKRQLIKGIKQDRKHIELINDIHIENMASYTIYVKFLNTLQKSGPPASNISTLLTEDFSGFVDSFSNAVSNLSSMASIVSSIASCSSANDSESLGAAESMVVNEGVFLAEEKGVIAATQRKIQSILNIGKTITGHLNNVDIDANIGAIFK